MGGGVAGVVSWVVTYPQDVIKSRLQADSFGSDRKYQGPLHCLQVED
jgi:solute carrier family 25 carnitine/acylcarnitine transporter 20/29